MRRIRTAAAAATFGLAAACASAASADIYMPVGPQTNVALSTVTDGGWTLCYQAPMSTFLGTSAESALSNCTGSNIMLAGRATGSDTLLALAQAPRADVFFNTGVNGNVTHNANGAEWYNADNFSWGFAPGGETVSKGQCDTTTGNGRICIHTVNAAGGYRINNLTGLNDSDAYEKLVFTNNGAVSAVPEPGAWAMLIAGFGLIGMSLRRRRLALAA